MRIVGIGEILWDLIQGNEYLGGALLNFCVHAARLGHDVSLLSAVGKDARGDLALKATAALGVSTDLIQRSNNRPTGIVTVTLAPDGQPAFIIHRPAAYDSLQLDRSLLARLASRNVEWICYGTLLSMYPCGRDLLFQTMEAFPCARRFYDVNLRPNSFTSELILELLRRATVVKLNENEADAMGAMFQRRHDSLQEFCRDNSAHFGWEAVCITRGERGCALLARDEYVEVPGYHVQVADTVGAGDAFASAFLHGLTSGWAAAEIGDFANRLGALVASRAGGVASWSLDQVRALSRSG